MSVGAPAGGRGAAALPADVEAAVARLRPVELVVALLTYNNAETVGEVVGAAVEGLAAHFPGVPAALVTVDAESADGTTDVVGAAGMPVVVARHPPPLTERAAVPFHGVPGRGPALRLAFATGRALGARGLVLLEADAAIEPAWLARLAGPVLEDKADFVAATYARHRWDGTITRLLLAPLVRALYGRRLRQPFPGQAAFAGRLLDHLLLHPRWDWSGRDVSDLWITGTAIADGYTVWEAWLGRHVVRSRTRTTDLPAMIAQTLGAVFRVMDRHQDLWLEVRGSEPLNAVGAPVPPSIDPMTVDVPRLVEGFRLGVRDLASIWELSLSAETLGEVLTLDVADPGGFRFPDELWAQVVYDFALAHHYGVVHRDHLLRSLVPLYLGRVAAFVVETAPLGAAASEARSDQVGEAFERRKPYLVERWR